MPRYNPAVVGPQWLQDEDGRMIGYRDERGIDYLIPQISGPQGSFDSQAAPAVGVQLQVNPLTGVIYLVLPDGTQQAIKSPAVSAETYNVIPNTGADLTTAIAAMLTAVNTAYPTGCAILLKPGTYIGDWVFAGRNGICLLGAGIPMKIASSLVYGTILKGSTAGSPAIATVSTVDAVAIEIGHLGVDQTASPVTVINAIQGGSSNANNDSIDLALYIHDVVCLGRGYLVTHGLASVGSQHGILVQGGKNVTIERVKAYWYGHPLAIRCSDSVVDTAYSEDCELTNIIYKSDTASGTINNCLRGSAVNVTAVSTNSANFCATAKVEALAAAVKTQGIKIVNFISVNSKTNGVECNSTAPTALTSISNASPAVFTKNGHGLTSGWFQKLSTTGTLPTGLDTLKEYTVVVLDANTYKVTYLGVDVNTSSAGSGTHSYTNGVLDDVDFVNPTVIGCAADRSYGLNFGSNISVVNGGERGNTFATGNFAYWAGSTTVGVSVIGTTDTSSLSKQTTGTFALAIINGAFVGVNATGTIQAQTRMMAASLSTASQGGASAGPDGASSFGGSVRIYKTAGGAIATGYTARWAMETASATSQQLKYEASFSSKVYGAEVNADFTKGGVLIDVNSTNGGRMSFGTSANAITPTARLELPANLVTTGFGQIHFDTTGALLTTPVAGTLEAVGDVLYYTNSAGRKTVTLS